MHPATARMKITEKNCQISSYELLQKIKRFNSVVKHYFLGHYSVAFTACADLSQTYVLNNCALGNWPNRPFPNVLRYRFVAHASGQEKKHQAAIDESADSL